MVTEVPPAIVPTLGLMEEISRRDRRVGEHVAARLGARALERRDGDEVGEPSMTEGAIAVIDVGL